MKFRSIAMPLMLLLGLVILGCTAAQLKEASEPTIEANGTTKPAVLSPATTQKIEIDLEKVDTVATKAQTVGTDIQVAGETGTALGIPFSGWATIAGGIITGLAGLYLQQRGKTSNATQAAVTIATAANNEAPVGLTPALSTAIQSIQTVAPEVHDAIAAAITTSPTVEAPTTPAKS